MPRGVPKKENWSLQGYEPWLEQEMKRDYHVITAQQRLERIADDFVEHYATRWESGKAMLVCIDKITCVRMYDAIMERWSREIAQLEAALPQTTDEQEEQERLRQIRWMRETQMAKETLSPAGIQRIKKVAVQLLAELKQNQLHMDPWTEKDATKAVVHNAIYDYLYNETSGLPAAYTPEEIPERAKAVFTNLVGKYLILASSTYSWAS